MSTEDIIEERVSDDKKNSKTNMRNRMNNVKMFHKT